MKDTAFNRLSAELTVTPVAANKKILDALIAAEGIATQAATLLGISRRSMVRILERNPSLQAEAKRIRAKNTKERAEARAAAKEEATS